MGVRERDVEMVMECIESQGQHFREYLPLKTV